MLPDTMSRVSVQKSKVQYQRVSTGNKPKPLISTLNLILLLI